MLKLNLCTRLSLIPPYRGLRNFKDGRGFKQWTGDDAKDYMKAGVISRRRETSIAFVNPDLDLLLGLHQIVLSALVGFIPAMMLCAIRELIDFSYLI